jgi:hypothetical protein
MTRRPVAALTVNLADIAVAHSPRGGVTMRLAFQVVGLAILSLTACVSSTAPNGDLNGTWAEVVQPNPGGGGMTMSLGTVGSTVIGTGQVCYVGGNCYPGAVTVTGTNAGSFRLSLSDGRGWSAVYAGSVVSRDELRGSWTDAQGSATILFTRAP